MTCKKCIDTPCFIVEEAKKLLGRWARERKRQGVGLFGELPDPDAMDAVAETSVDNLLKAVCDCKCHEETRKLKR